MSDTTETITADVEELHADYPHFPGRLPGCDACDACCHCGPEVEAGCETECVYEGAHRYDAPLIVPGATGDAWYAGPLEAGKRLARADMFVFEYTIEHPEAGTVYVVDLAFSDDRNNVASFGRGPDPETAWRYALGAEFGPLDEGYDADHLTRALAKHADD